MKRFINFMFAALALVGVAGVAASANEVSKSVTLTHDVVVDGTNVKKGDYTVKFDEQSGELSIIKGGKVIVKTTASAEKLAEKAERTMIYTATKGQVIELQGFTFSGQDRRINLGNAGVPPLPPAKAAAHRNRR